MDVPALETAPPADAPSRGGRSREGGLDALEQAYRRHCQAVFRFALRCVGRRDLAEDLTSEAFLALHRNLDNVDLSQLPSWLFTVVKNRAVDHWRRRETERRYAESAPEAEPAALPPAVASGLLESGLLKPIHRICLVLRYVHGLSRLEIAEKTGLSETQVKGHLQYARELLRKDLEKSG